MRRLTKLSGIGPELAQELADSVFRHFDVALREIGVSDVRGSQTNQTDGRGLLRAQQGPPPLWRRSRTRRVRNRLAGALARNVYGAADAGLAPMARGLAQFLIATAEALDRIPLETSPPERSNSRNWRAPPLRRRRAMVESAPFARPVRVESIPLNGRSRQLKPMRREARGPRQTEWPAGDRPPDR